MINGAGVFTMPYSKNLPEIPKNLRVWAGDGRAEISFDPAPDDCAGVRVVKKEGAVPAHPFDGSVCEVTDGAYEDESLENCKRYYWRLFPYNASRQFQTQLAGAVCSALPHSERAIDSLEVGDRIRVGIKEAHRHRYGESMDFLIAAKNHPGYPKDSAVLIAEKLVTTVCFDAAEPENTTADSFRTRAGNNRYKLSNVNTWLQSAEPSGNWYIARHPYDAPPTAENMWLGYNAFYGRSGFLAAFEGAFAEMLLTAEIDSALNPIDGGGYERLSAKVYLPGAIEIGVAQEDSDSRQKKFPLFEQISPIAYMHELVLENSDFKDPALEPRKPGRWLLRDARTSEHGSLVQVVSLQGNRMHSSASEGMYTVRPATCISLGEGVKKEPTADGAYVLIV